MCPPFDLFDVMAVGTQADVAGIAIAGNYAVGAFVEGLHFVMREKSAGDELELLTTL